MPLITETTLLNAPIEKCLELSLSVDLHQRSLAFTGEKAIGGVTSGILKLNDSVQWRARHFGWYFKMTVSVTELVAPVYFVDEMIKGPFKKVVHRHYFESLGHQTIMRDEFYFEAPLGILGKAAEKIFLTNYMAKLLNARNKTIKAEAEGDGNALTLPANT